MNVKVDDAELRRINGRIKDLIEQLQQSHKNNETAFSAILNNMYTSKLRGTLNNYSQVSNSIVNNLVANLKVLEDFLSKQISTYSAIDEKARAGFKEVYDSLSQKALVMPGLTAMGFTGAYENNQTTQTSSIGPIDNPNISSVSDSSTGYGQTSSVNPIDNTVNTTSSVTGHDNVVTPKVRSTTPSPGLTGPKVHGYVSVGDGNNSGGNVSSVNNANTTSSVTGHDNVVTPKVRSTTPSPGLTGPKVHDYVSVGDGNYSGGTVERISR